MVFFTLIVTAIVLNRSGYEKDGTPTNELGNGWGFQPHLIDYTLHFDSVTLSEVTK